MITGANHVVIAKGEIKTDGNAGGMKFCLDNQRRLFTTTHGPYAQSLVDQEGSVSLVYGNQLVNNPTDKDWERAVGDFLYFTD